MVLVLGCLLGVVGVLALRSPRKAGLFISALILLVPLGALADFPHPKFADGTIAHGYEVSDDLKELVPHVGTFSAACCNGALPGVGGTQSFFSSSTVTAPSFSALQCIVKANLVFKGGSTNNILFWLIAMNIGGTATLEPAPALDNLPGNPLPFAVNSAADIYSYGTSSATFTIPAGQSASFGAKLTNVSPNSISNPAAAERVVYNCTITPPAWTSGP
jgi:hypothetical protein